MTPLSVTRPHDEPEVSLCQSERVRILHAMRDALFICACDACSAQFSVSLDPDTRLPKA